MSFKFTTDQSRRNESPDRNAKKNLPYLLFFAGHASFFLEVVHKRRYLAGEQKNATIYEFVMLLLRSMYPVLLGDEPGPRRETPS